MAIKGDKKVHEKPTESTFLLTIQLIGWAQQGDLFSSLLIVSLNTYSDSFTVFKGEFKGGGGNIEYSEDQRGFRSLLATS